MGPFPLTSLLLQPSDTAPASDAPARGTPASSDATPGSRASRPTKPGSSFTALTRIVHEMGLMRRRYGYYWAKLIGAVVLLAVWVAAFVWIGDSWWQLASATVLAVAMTQIAFLGHDAAHRQMFKSPAVGTTGLA